MSAPRYYPAIDVQWPAHPGEDAIGALLAAIDDTAPSAVEDLAHGCRVFFTGAEARTRAVALAASAASLAIVTSVDVSDEAWAERSQAGLTPVTIGDLTVAPPWAPVPQTAVPTRWITIQPSMGFGTGHHQSTRLCLRLLQRLDLTGARVTDIGTGSGVLAIAAARLGAAAVLAVDYDADAVASARENVSRNGVESVVTLRVVGIGPGPHRDWDEPTLGPDCSFDASAAADGAGFTEIVPTNAAGRAPGTGPADAGASFEVADPVRADVVLANLTGASLVRLAGALARSVAPGGALIASGFQDVERDAVAAAFAGQDLRVEDEGAEDRWIGLCFGRVL
jgi:ribosomal protein L11 methyltransferase